MDVEYNWILTSERLPDDNDDNTYILYTVDDSGDISTEHVVTGWRCGDVWIVNNEICYENVVAWMPLPSVSTFRDVVRRMNAASKFKVGNVVEDGYGNYLITEITPDGLIRCLDEGLNSAYVHAEKINKTDACINVEELKERIANANALYW